MRASRLFIALAAFVVICVLAVTTAQMRVIDLVSATTNSPPVAAADTFTGLAARHQDAPGVLANDSDPDGDALIVNTNPVVSPQHGYLTLYGDGSFYYTPNSSYGGTDTFTYQVCDSQGACANGMATLLDANHAPTAGNDNFSGLEARHQEAPGVLANDSDADGDPVYIDPSYNAYAQHGYVTLYGNGSFYYGPGSGYVGPDSFSYRLCDQFEACSVATVTLNNANSAPVVGTDFFFGNAAAFQSSSPVRNVLINDHDSEGDQLVIDVGTSGGGTQHNGYLNIYGNGDFYYTPPAGYTGTDSFTYRVCDSLGACSNGTVTLFVIGDGKDHGACDCKGRVAEPINVTNGNMYLQQGDYQLPAVGPAIEITRTYNSDSQRLGLFGRGWSTAYDQSLVAFDNNLVRLNEPDGRATYFGRLVGASGAFMPLKGDFQGQLVQNASGFTLSIKDGSVRQFNSVGKLISLADRVGNQTTLTYDTGGKLTSVTDRFGRVLSFTTNANGQVLSIADTLGTVATYTYGGGNQLLSVTYADNSAFQFTYDGNYRLTSVTDALGNILESHTYDSQGRALTSEKQGGVERYTLSYVSSAETDVTDALSHVTKYNFDTSKGRNVVTQVEGLCSCGGSQVQSWTYDNQLNVTSKTDAVNHTTTYTYDSNGNRLTETDATGTVTFTYNSFGEVLARTEQLNGVTTNTYDAAGNLLTTKDALNNTTTFTYDARGQLLTMTNALGKVTTLTWDTSGRLTQAKDALNNTTNFTYDARARLTSTTNALTFVTSYAYDLAGRVNKITRPNSTFITFTYDLAGRRTKVTDALNNSTSFAYDSAYRLTTVTDAALKATTYNYDLMSNLTGTTDALVHTTNYEYDDFNRLLKTIYPPAVIGGARLQETVEYDAAGNVTKRTDTAGRITSLGYDNANRLLTVTDPALQITQYEYNPRSNVTAVVDALGQRYTFDYDALSRVTTATRAGLQMSFVYDAVGNRAQRTDYNNMTTSYTYDELNRLTKITYPDASTVNYGYDKLSQMNSAANINGTVSFTYDNLGRATSTTDVFGQVLNYTYDANDRRTKLSFGATTNATYIYDAVNRLTQITDSANLAVSYVYDATSKLTSKTLPNGVAATYTYDGLDRLTRLKDAKRNKVIADNQYSYNNAGDITQNIDQSGTHGYGYDTIDRLTSATYTGTPNETYAYDGVGNRTSSHKSTTYGYQPNNRLVSTSTASYLYNNNGNLISKSDAGGTTQFAWDFENRLVQVVTPSSGSVTYKYDALGRRIQRTPSSGVSTNFIYDDQDVVKDINSDGTTVEYLNGPGIDNKIRQKGSTSSTTYYFSQDHLGSTTALTGTTGKLVERQTYDAYGNSAGSTRTRYGYTGRERDQLTGLLYYRARFYDPQLGRFVSEDPMGFDGGDVNVYAYVGSNPILFSDPSGRWSPDAHAEIIKQALENCLDVVQRRQLQDASEWVDRAAGQLEANAYQHGMRGGPNESVEHARNAAGDFISEHIQKARNLAPQGCKGGYGKIPWNALWEFGQALHTITDMTSPAHEGFQIWYGPPYPTGNPILDPYNAAKYAGYVKWHHDQETLQKLLGDPQRLQMIKNKVRDAFAKTFGDCGCCGD